MPRVAITITLIDDENLPLAQEAWSPLGYADFGDPDLPASHPQGYLINNSERILLDRLRTSIDRSLLTFARRERRRFRAREAAPNPNVQPTFEENYETFQGEFLQPETETLGVIFERFGNSVRELTETQIHELFATQPAVEEKKEPKKTRTRQVKRVSRYKRDPVI